MLVEWVELEGEEGEGSLTRGGETGLVGEVAGRGRREDIGNASEQTKHDIRLRDRRRHRARHIQLKTNTARHTNHELAPIAPHIAALARR